MPSSVKDHSSHMLLAGTTAATARTSDHHRVTAMSWNARVLVLVDALIDRVHQRWPAESGVLYLPTGESLFISGHRTDDPACHPGHIGYYRTRVRPNCAADPIPHQRGTSGLRPLVMDVNSAHGAHGTVPVARYTLDLRTGELLIEHDVHTHRS